MYLKKLELIGFKSFADPTTITFQPGITVTVGPNGCGKSNIVDAVLWVLGEQSTKTLRSDRMEDVIFNGSESRKPINMVEVILTVGGITPEEIGNQFGEFRELSLCRRLFRSGESEYLINRIPCRLKDIRDVLIDTGAGHKGHTIIEQGKVDQLLNTSPIERRGLIEETAGIAKYKIRQVAAERKLEATQQNLVRVRDIISEVKRQIQGLDRQVKRTETYNVLRAEAQRLEQLLLAHDYRGIYREWQEVAHQAQEAHTTESALLAKLSTSEADIQNAKLGLVEEEQALAGLRQRVYDLQTQVHRQENRIELLRSQIVTWEDQRGHLTEEQEYLIQEQVQAKAGLEGIRQQQQTVQKSIQGLKEQLDHQDQVSRELDAQVAQQAATLEQDKSRLFERLGLITEDKNQAAALESRYREILRAQEKSRGEWTAVAEQLKQKQKEMEEGRFLLAGFEKNVGEAQEYLKHLSESTQKKRHAIAQLDHQANRLRDELTRLEARLASLKEQAKNLLAAQTSLEDHLMGQPDLLERFTGIVGDGLSVPSDYERAIEAVLGDRFQALIAEDHPTIQAAIHHLKTAGAARRVFVPKHLRMRPGIPGFTARDGVIGPAIACVATRPGFETLVQALLGGVILVRDLTTALDIWKEQPLSEILVTLAGEVVFPSGMVAGGQPPENGHGFLQTRRKVRELEDEIQRLRTELIQVEEVRTRQDTELEHLNSEQDGLIQRQHQGELEAAAQHQKVAALEGDLHRLSEHRTLLETEDHHRTLEIRDLEGRMEQVRRRIEDLEAQHNRLQNKMAEEQGGLRQWEDQSKTLSSELTQLKVDLTSLTERQEALGREERRLQQEMVSLSDRYRQRQAEVEGLAARIQTAQQDSEETEASIGALTKTLTDTQGSFTEKTQQYSEHLSCLKQLEEAQSRVRGDCSQIERLLKGLEIRQVELKTKLDHLREQLVTSHSITPEDALPKLDQEPFDREEASSRVTELRTRIDQMGPVNLAAPDEYKELEGRYQFLTTQEADLTRSIEDLKKAIQKISRTTREMFLSAYQALRVKFSEVFRAFFQGGQADLIIQDENNPLESGIEIMAEPPGKRLRHISLLSGGEKALTAIALLFASFLIHPSPFCVLDEIDAPLDEENTRRFLRALRQMANHSQFFVITHNTRTMEEADILYGVTMEEPGVSKLVSVKLESRGNGDAAGNKSSVKAVVSPSAAV